jgi:hypothetical protein
MFSFNEWVQLREGEIRGEYWIDNTGSNMYADGDIGDVGHEAHVINIIQHEIIDKFGYYKFDRGDYIDWDGFINQLAKDKIKEDSLNPDDDEFDEDEVVEKAFEDEGIDNETIHIAYGHGDAREYAMKHWGWKALRGHNVESWTLTPRDMQIIARGIASILDDEGDMDDSKDDEMEFYVSAYRKSALILTLRELRAGQPDSISTHATQSTIMSKPLQMQADRAVKDQELQSMHPYYRNKEVEPKPQPEKLNPTSVAQRKGALKPGRKWWALNSESSLYKS